MPKPLERKLERIALRRGYGKARRRRYVFGTLSRLGLLGSGHRGKR